METTLRATVLSAIIALSAGGSSLAQGSHSPTGPIPVTVCIEPGLAVPAELSVGEPRETCLVLLHSERPTSVASVATADGLRFPVQTVDVHTEVEYSGAEFAVGRTLRGWLVSEEIELSGCFEIVPSPDFTAIVETVAPGGGVWLDAGARHGLRRGMLWWRRQAGQPVAVLETVFVDSDTAFCRAFALRTPCVVEPGDAFCLWPSPENTRAERVVSAVSHVEPSSDEPLLWIARPPHFLPRPGAGVEITRNGEYVGFAALEIGNERFCLARVNSAACTVPPQVGDDVRFRTIESGLRSEFDARIFAASEDGYLISAGETERISAGDIGVLWRDGEEVGSVRVERLQAAYSRVVATQLPGGGARRLDSVRFAPAEPGPTVAGFVSEVYDDSVVALWLPAGARAGDRYALMEGGRTTALAVVLDAEGSFALAWTPRRMRSGPVSDLAIAVWAEP